jgi:hypothetical protein
MATEKQVRYALYLLRDAGYSTDRMNSSFRELGARCRERSGRVRAWLEGMEITRASDLIDRLKAELESRRQGTEEAPGQEAED